jgi:hypothetical protein
VAAPARCKGTIPTNAPIAKTELPVLTPEQLQVLWRFASLEVDVEEVPHSLAGIFEIDLEPERRTASVHFRVPEPGIAITRDHISKALEQKRLGLISERELVYWATMLLLNERRVHTSADPRRAFHLWMLSKLFPTKDKAASLAFGEVPSVPEKGPSPKRAPEKGPRKGPAPRVSSCLFHLTSK